MPLSQEMQDRYSAEVDVDWAEALIISHSQFPTLYVSTWHENITGMVDGVVQTFLPLPFEILLPTRDGEGQQDLKITACNIGYEFSQAIDAAMVSPAEYIRCRYTIYIVGDTTAQLDPMIDLALTDITATELIISATATRANIFNLSFPHETYTPARYPGLIRR